MLTTPVLLRRRRAGGDPFAAYTADGNVPATVADFAADRYLGTVEALGDLTFSRASSATYVTSAGLFATAASGAARTGHHMRLGGAWTRGGLLKEQAATNRCVASTPGSTYWAGVRASITSGATTSPFGVAAASPKLVEDTATNSHILLQTMYNATATDTVTASFLVKAAERNLQISLIDNPANVGGTINNFDIVFQPSTGLITSSGSSGSPTNTASGVEAFGGGWYRVWLRLTKKGGATRTDLKIYLTNTTTYAAIPAYAGDGTSGVYMDCVQVEEGSYPSSFIPTSGGATAARSADVLSLAGARTPFSATAMTIQMAGYLTQVPSASGQAEFVDWVKDGSNLITMKSVENGSGAAHFQTLLRNAGVLSITSQNSQYDVGQRVPFNVAATVSTSEVATAAEEDLGTPASATAIPALSASAMVLGDATFNGVISRLVIWDADIGDAGLIEATALDRAYDAAATSAYYIGDSTIAAYLGQNAVSAYVDSVRTEVMLAIPNDTIAQQKADWVALTLNKKEVGWVGIQVGLNDLDPAEAAATAIARLQDLVDTVRADISTYSKIMIGQMIPCRSRLITIYGATDGPIAYQKWLDMNEAISGSGANAITGVDARATAHVALLNDGSGNLDAAYDTGDGIHPNNAGREIIGTSWEDALTGAGITV